MVQRNKIGGSIWKNDERRMEEERRYVFTGGRRDGVTGARNRCYGSFKVTETILTNQKYPTSIIKIGKEHNGHYHHPTQKPVNLIRWLVRTFTNEGELVLDNCMGSGTTAVACINEKRHFIGFEMQKEYYDIACQRIKLEQAQLKLF